MARLVDEARNNTKIVRLQQTRQQKEREGERYSEWISLQNKRWDKILAKIPDVIQKASRSGHSGIVVATWNNPQYKGDPCYNGVSNTESVASRIAKWAEQEGFDVEVIDMVYGRYTDWLPRNKDIGTSSVYRLSGSAYEPSALIICW